MDVKSTKSERTVLVFYERNREILSEVTSLIKRRGPCRYVVRNMKRMIKIFFENYLHKTDEFGSFVSESYIRVKPVNTT